MNSEMLDSETLDLVIALSNDIEKYVAKGQALNRRCKEVQTRIQALQSGKEQAVTKKERDKKRIHAEMQKRLAERNSN